MENKKYYHNITSFILIIIGFLIITSNSIWRFVEPKEDCFYLINKNGTDSMFSSLNISKTSLSTTLATANLLAEFVILISFILAKSSNDDNDKHKNNPILKVGEIEMVDIL